MDKIILDLCGGTGAWSKPYKDAGYDVRLITWPDNTVLCYTPPSNVYGILAAPPCTMFSHARTIAKEPRDTAAAMVTVYACLRIIWDVQYGVKTGEKKTPLKFWALENPGHGILKNFLGKPAFEFNPYDFGDDHKKLTYLWGWFSDPKKHPGNKLFANDHNHKALPKFDKMKTRDIAPEHYGKLTRQERRAITPARFAQAFFEANK